MPFAPSSKDATSSYLLLVVMPLVAPLFLVAVPFAPSSKDATSSYLLLVVMPGAPSSALVPSSDALCS